MTLIATLIGIALVLFLFEIFVPGGILGVMGILCMFAACWVAYTEIGPVGATITFLVALVISLGMFILELKVISKTRFGEGFFHRTSLQETSLKPQAGPEVIGKVGETSTRMNPTGMVLIDGVQYEASSRTGLLGKGVYVKVVNVDNFRMIVEKA